MYRFVKGHGVLRKLLLTTTAIVAFAAPTVATADPVTTAIGAALAQATAGVISVIGIGATNALISFGASALLNAAARAIAGGPKGARQQDIKRELALSQSKPPKRSVYGRYKAPGSPVPLRVKGDFVYMCLLLNSRPSEGNPTIYFDGREAEIESGDLFNFAGSGAVLTPVDTEQSFGSSGRKPKAWMALGGQTTAPAEIVADLDGDILSTDAWTGCTVLWLKVDAGANEQRADTWPRTPPDVEVLGDWSKVWNPSDPAQDPNDPATWQFSRNQSLCLLDALRNNPIESRPIELLRLDMFTDGATVAARQVPRFYAGGTVDQYTTDGVLIWRDAELMDQIQPLVDAGGGDLVQIGGKLGYVAPQTIAPSYTITDILQEGGMEFKRLLPGSQIPKAISASYVAPDRGWQDSDIPALAVGGGPIPDAGIVPLPLPFVTEATQAMRIQKIVRNRAAAQRRLSVMLPPDAITLTVGSIVQWGIPELPRCNGLWRVVSCKPSLWLQGDGVAFRIPVELEEEPANVDAWDPETDEFELATETYTPPAPVRLAPDDLTLTTGPGVAVGTTARIRLAFSPVAGNVSGYEWQWRQVGGAYEEGGIIGAEIQDGAGDAFAHLSPVLIGATYEVRVRTIYLGAASDYASASIVAQGPAYDLDPPHSGTCKQIGAGEVEVTFTTPNNANFTGFELWGASSDDIAFASLVETVYSAPNMIVTVTETGLGPSATRFYFARSLGPVGSGAVSVFSASVTTP